jgi:hypothetical protein
VAVKTAGLPAGTSYHDLRHFYASLLIDHGESVKVVQRRLGHASATETLDTYSHLWPDSEDRTRDAVDSVLDASSCEPSVSQAPFRKTFPQVRGVEVREPADKPDPVTYAYVLSRLRVSAAAAAYVGDGSSDELVGARSAGFGMVILAEEAAARSAPDELPRLRAQADASVLSLPEVVDLVNR